MWVPIENGLMSITKIVLLVILAVSLPRSGIFASWSIATGLVVVGVNGLMFSKLLHAPTRPGTSLPGDDLRLRQLIRPAVHNQVANVFALAALNAMPLIVVFRLGASPTAFFAIPWAIYVGLQQIASAMSFSLTVEAATTPAKLSSFFRQTLMHAFMVLGPAVAVIVVFAPQLLRLLGPEYAAHGTGLLRWLAAASLPGAVVPMTLALARIKHRTSIVMGTQGLSSVAVIVLSTALLHGLGIAAVGVSTLATNSVVAVVAGWRYLWPVIAPVDLRAREAR
jgi:O-antigen/teichoic acid export membrane protein